MRLTLYFILALLAAPCFGATPRTDSLDGVSASAVPDTLFDENLEYDDDEYVAEYAATKTRDSLSALRYDASTIQFRAMDSTALAELRSQKEFIYDRKPPAPSVWDLIRDWFWRQLGKAFNAEEFATFWDVFVYAFVFFALVFVVLKLTQTDLRGLFYDAKKVDALSFREEELLGADALTKLIDDAVSKKDYRRAVRYLFLRLLKELAAQGAITWRPGKTNRDYVRELKRADLKEPLAELARLFEFVWYGEFALSDATFENARRSFDAFTVQLGEK